MIMTTSPMYLLILCFMALLVLTLRSTYWHRLHQLLHQVTTTTTRVSRFGQEKQANAFARNIEEGLSSANFDLQLNVINQGEFFFFFFGLLCTHDFLLCYFYALEILMPHFALDI